MASKSTLNAKNLETLGAARLADLLIEISTGSAVAKRRLRLELAGAQSPKEAGREVAKRLTSIARARSFVNWQNRKPLVTDLQSQIRAIKEQIAPADPTEALALTWRFMQIATPLFERCDDSSGIVIGVFHDACVLLGEIALAAGTPPEALADAAIEALRDNGYGQYDGLIAILTPALGAEGLGHLKQRIEVLAATPVPVPPKTEWEAVGYGLGGATYVHQMQERARQSLVRMALKDIADAMGDVDAFIAQYDPATRKVPKIAAEIAARLLATGRAGDALGFVERAEVDKSRWMPHEWQDARLEVLEALDRNDEAQAFRWACFERDLSPDYLRAFLKRLPDFEDIDAEDRAMAYAMAYPIALSALQFLLRWPALDRAAQLVQQRFTELDGDHYEILTPAAEVLAARFPLAATLALRAMIDFTLNAGKSSRYQHAARHLAECDALASQIEDYGTLERHAAYVAHLKRDHGRKTGFWAHFA
ncbi:MAG: hypothetical protein U1A24_16045 [Cypionkella sp.]|uniref:DUF6880 family protein n=1 Tax=Cypionkella sp. TaxID=2811411 RepID=UPI002ABBC6BA|nr:DUF6880 family protein [Cypionkella sp.]MDZ4312059.1 hypothetical protein [Cypionkella sp.]